TKSARRTPSDSCRRQARNPARAGSLSHAVLGSLRRVRAGDAALLTGENIQRLLMHALVARDDDATAALCRAILPGRDDASGDGNDRNDGDNVVRLDLG